MEVGTRLIADKEYGTGTVKSVHSENMMTVKFDNLNLPIMCSYKSMSTIHSGIKSKLKILKEK